MDPTSSQNTRLSAVERNRSWLWKLARLVSLRRFGKVLTPLKVVYSRKPALIPISAAIDWVRERKLHLDSQLRFLVLVRTSQLNDCSFCHDLVKAQAIRAKLGVEKFGALHEWDKSELFSGRERVLLAATEELCKTHDLSEETFAALKEHFSDDDIVEIIWLCASETYFNIMAHSLRIPSDRLAQPRT
ncbi:MAG: hypothetical protein KatS3mg077_1473 [Candidatus Binatia bacterium]|nr:MAG: hypothetical protein KatS3mg077_1473 [Candidatus Binatia bacterium]